METLRLIFRMRIHDGKLEAFKAVAAEILDIVIANGGDGTVDYDWFMNDDESECVVVETFADSEALLAHADRVNEPAVRMFGMCDLENLWLCGNPSPAVVEKTSAYGAGVYRYLQRLP